MLGIRVSCAKMRRALGYEPSSCAEEAISEVGDAIVGRLITGPLNSGYRNTQFIVQ